MASSSREAEYKRQARDRNREYVRKIKEDNPCTDCGEYYHYSQMDFDHIDGKKKHNISRVANSAVSIKTIKDELRKCELVCANCHRLRTWQRLNKVVQYKNGKSNEYES
jgi:hypothetical protein